MRLHTLLLSCLMLFCSGHLRAAPASDTAPAPMAPSPATLSVPLKWYTNYEQAVQQAKTAGKPIVLFFTGSDWCRFCKLLDKQALNTPEFAALAGARFIFVKIDLPQDTSTLDPVLAAQNKALRKKYDIRTYPTLILLDANERQIGKTEYRDYNGRQYAEHLLKMIQQVNNYQQRMATLQQHTFTNTVELEQLYQQAQQLHFEDEAALILKTALVKTPASPYFLKERYRTLAQEGKLRSQEAQALRRQILALDPQNTQHSHLDLAVIDFETYCGELAKEQQSPEVAIAPLVAYLERFSLQDPDTAWRLQMLISQVFLDNDQLTKALKYAQNSYQLAPAAARPDIALTIQNIQTHLHH